MRDQDAGVTGRPGAGATGGQDPDARDEYGRGRTGDDEADAMLRSAIEGVKGGLLKGRAGGLWRRFAPIGVGAAGSAAMIVGAAELARRILRRPGRHSSGWIAALAIPVLAILLRPTAVDEETEPADDRSSEKVSVPNGRSGEDEA